MKLNKILIAPRYHTALEQTHKLSCPRMQCSTNTGLNLISGFRHAADPLDPSEHGCSFYIFKFERSKVPQLLNPSHL